MGSERDLTGHYFIYCQWCEEDGKCVLLHHEYLGLPAGKGVDRTPYPGHENIGWHFMGFQGNSTRNTCTGRIRADNSMYLPLACECGTAIGTFGGLMCRKFSPNEEGRERRRLAEQIAADQKIPLSGIRPDQLPEPDPNYSAEMDQ